MTPQRLHRDFTRSAGSERRHDLLVVARPEMCEARWEEPFDGLRAWIFCAR